MIVTTGKSIRVEILAFGGCLILFKNADTPGAVSVSGKGEGTITLPANPEDMEKFIRAYRRVVEEDVGYRTRENE